MWVEAITFFLGVSLVLYSVLGGADFGAGILELFLARKQRDAQRRLISHAIGPVWEANHVWIILAVVILMNGFPRAFYQLSLSFHLPLTAMLIGIVLRGCAFTFRHYDAIRDRSQIYYSRIFVASSILAPFTLGITAGGMLLGRLDPTSTDFYQQFIYPWFNLFSFSVGLFVCVLFAFIAAVYMIGESDQPELQRIFIARARAAQLLAIVSGLLVFGAAEWDGFGLARLFLERPVSLVAMGLATGILFPIWSALRERKILLSRIGVATQITLILIGWFNIQYPDLIATSNATHSITIYDSAAPEATLRYLLYALIAGSILIFPSLIFLLKVFKMEPDRT